ncbi:hypothetical protein, partial [Enterobacter hormaechei]
RRMKRHMPPGAVEDFLDEAGKLRHAATELLARAPVRGPLYLSLEGILGAIDSVAEIVKGDRRHFHEKGIASAWNRPPD